MANGQAEEPHAAECADYLARARALAPAIAAAGAEMERTRRVPPDVLAGLHGAALFRMLLPRSLVGGEVHPLTFTRVVEELARSEASVAWNVCQNAVCATVAAYLPPEVAQAIFAAPDAILAWGPPGPGTRAIADDRGYRVTGNWSFASGGRHATWLGAQAPLHDADGTPRMRPDGGPDVRVLLFPAAAAAWREIWNVVGLRATASDAYSVEELHIPSGYSVARDDRSHLREPGWLYGFGTIHLFAAGFAHVALGVVRSMLDALLALAADKTPRGAGGGLRDNAALQAELARAEARYRAARAYLRTTLTELCIALQGGGALTLEQRMALRLAATHTIQEAVQVGNFAYGAAGSDAIFAERPFERRFRDLHAIAQQVQGRSSHYETAGKHLLGHDVRGPFL